MFITLEAVAEVCGTTLEAIQQILAVLEVMVAVEEVQRAVEYRTHNQELQILAVGAVALVHLLEAVAH
jgi:hypothetical protein